MVSAGVGDYRAIIKSNEEKMEQQQKLIMNLHSVIQTLQETIESLNKKLEKFETPKGTGAKEKGAAATLVEPNNAHEGWTEVGLKKPKAKQQPVNQKQQDDEEKKMQESTLRLSKTLVLDDWDVPLVKSEELGFLTKGFCFVTQKVGEGIFAEVGGRLLSAPKGQLAIVTPAHIEAAANKNAERLR